MCQALQTQCEHYERIREEEKKHTKKTGAKNMQHKKEYGPHKWGNSIL